MCRHSPTRRAMTLIELLVVVFIMAVLFGLAAFSYPFLTARQKMTSATDRISQMLLIAKQRAKRDGLPTGVRISATELQYIQQPDTPAIGRVTRIQPGVLPGTSVVTISDNLAPISSVDPLVAVGDYLEIGGGGRLHQVVAPAPVGGVQTTVTIDLVSASIQNFTNNTTAANLSNYRIIPRPRLLGGEDAVKLPESTQVNPTLSRPTFTSLPNYVDILFSPAGNVVGQATNDGHVFLVVEDTDPVNNNPPKFIVAIRLRTGLIGVYPYSEPPATDPYLFARDGRSSGL